MYYLLLFLAIKYYEVDNLLSVTHRLLVRFSATMLQVWGSHSPKPEEPLPPESDRGAAAAVGGWSG